jgi:hypothetical protein
VSLLEELKRMEEYFSRRRVVPLSERGTNTEDNIATVCPNGHREAHHGAWAADIRRSLHSRVGGQSRGRRGIKGHT